MFIKFKIKDAKFLSKKYVANTSVHFQDRNKLIPPDLPVSVSNNKSKNM